MNTDLTKFDKLKASITMFVAPTKDITVTDSGTNTMAQGVLRTLTDFRKQVTTALKAEIDPHKEYIKRINSYADQLLEPLEASERIVKCEISRWVEQEANKRAEEQRKIQAEREASEWAAQAARETAETEARKIREDEERALKLKLDAERKALEFEQKKKAEALKVFGIDDAKRKEEAAALKRAHEERAAAERVELNRRNEESRIAAEAKLQREQEENIAALRTREKQLEADRPKNTRQIPEWEIIDQKVIPEKYWIVNESILGSDIRGGAREIPGVKITMKTVVVSR